VLIEYQSLAGGPGDGFTCGSTEWDDAYGERSALAARAPSNNKHVSDNANNSYSALRFVRGAHQLLYAEFADVSQPEVQHSIA
jgi:hypothetical protein